MFSFLEVWVREKEKHLGELTLFEEVGQVLHGVAPETGNVRVLARVLGSQGYNSVLYIIRNLDTDLHSLKHGGLNVR